MSKFWKIFIWAASFCAVSHMCLIHLLCLRVVVFKLSSCFAIFAAFARNFRGFRKKEGLNDRFRLQITDLGVKSWYLGVWSIVGIPMLAHFGCLGVCTYPVLGCLRPRIGYLIRGLMDTSPLGIYPYTPCSGVGIPSPTPSLRTHYGSRYGVDMSCEWMCAEWHI